MADHTTFLKVEQVARKLKVHPETVRRLVRRGELPYVPIGRQIRIAHDTLIAWRQQRERTR